MTKKEFKEKLIKLFNMSYIEINGIFLNKEYSELWNKLSNESIMLIKQNAMMYENLMSCKNSIKEINEIVYEYELYEDDETGTLYNEEDDVIFSLDDYCEVNRENMIDFIYAYELKRGIKL